MSYILEALKKSQQERELGQVPTLKTPILLAEAKVAPPNPWVLVAVGLAALAVVIALYGAWRDGSPVAPPSVQGMAPDDGPGSSQPPAEAPPPSPIPSLAASPAAVAAVAPGPPPTAAAPAVDEARADRTREAVDPPPPVLPAIEAEFPDLLYEPDEADFLVEEPAAAGPSKIPPDLIADIEAFKRRVSAGEAGNVETAEAIPPQDLKLPKDVQRRLPSFVMSAHIYDETPAKRFVLINGLKTREGEESREAITVERILPDGAVLRYEGHRFFQRR